MLMQTNNRTMQQLRCNHQTFNTHFTLMESNPFNAQQVLMQCQLFNAIHYMNAYHDINPQQSFVQTADQCYSVALMQNIWSLHSIHVRHSITASKINSPTQVHRSSVISCKLKNYTTQQHNRLWRPNLRIQLSLHA